MTGDGLSRGLSDMWRSVVLYLPSIVAFLVILIVGYLLARLARTVTTKILRRAGFDRAVQRGPAGRLLRPGAPSATDVCARLAFLVVLLFALQLAFGVFGPNPASELINALIGWLPRVFVGIVIVVVAAAVAGAAHDLILAVLGGLGYARVLAKAVAAVIVTLGVIAGLDQVGIATSVTRPLLVTILATVAGVIIVGVGGGLIRPMQQRWEGWLDRAAAESATIREQARAYAEERARQASGEEARPAASGPPAPGASSAPAGSPPAPAVDASSHEDDETRAATSWVPESDRSADADGQHGGVDEPVPERSAAAARTRGAASGDGARTYAAGADPGRRGDGRPLLDDAEELAWEARWAGEERRSGEQDGDETQVIIAPPPGGGGDERTTDLHAPDGERTTDLHAPDGDEPTTALRAAGQEDTVVVSSGTAETTILIPGVRPERPPATVAADDEATVPGTHSSEAETTALLAAGDGVPTETRPTASGKPDAT